MDAAATIRTAPPPPATAAVRAGGAGAEPKTVLAPAKAIRAAGQAESPTHEAWEKQVEIDPKTRDVIYRLVDTQTGDLVSQMPAEAILNMRAYVRDTESDTAESDRKVEKIA